jgi:hypothetical protein
MKDTLNILELWKSRKLWTQFWKWKFTSILPQWHHRLKGSPRPSDGPSPTNFSNLSNNLNKHSKFSKIIIYRLCIYFPLRYKWKQVPDTSPRQSTFRPTHTYQNHQNRTNCIPQWCCLPSENDLVCKHYSCENNKKRFE